MTGQAVFAITFYALSVAALSLAFAVVTARKLLRAAIALMGVLSMSAGFYVMLEAEFLAGIQVLVYVGGIVILMIFAVMLTRSADLMEKDPTFLRKLLGAASSLSFFCSTVVVLRTSPFLQSAEPVTATTENARVIGRALMDYGPTGYVLPFELVSLLLLAALIGGIVISRKTLPFEQPFTSGGDLPGEADFVVPLTQSDKAVEGGDR
ncbi:MAG: NADH-quinone oxidoreductase subunit J [Candidatus Riflebacteria bacterium]|nr:NADH-quinone oxidoreductase subunit J [Candidatus Riflebacteria bacterium]